MRRLLWYTKIVLLLAGCIDMNSSKNLTTSLSIISDPSKVLDPSDIDFVSQYYYLDNLTRRLVKLDSTGQYEYDLAEEIIKEDDEKKWTIKLKNSFFSDGTKINSKVVVDSLTRAFLKGSSHFNSNDLFDLDKLKVPNEIPNIKIIDESSFSIKLNKGNSEFMYYLTLADLGVLSKSQLDKEVITYQDWTDKVSGPYYLKIMEGSTILKANKFYPHSPNAPLEIKNLSQLGIDNLIENKAIDYGPIPFRYYLDHTQKISEKGYEILTSPNQSIVSLCLNTNLEKFSLANRKWIYSKISSNFKIPSKYDRIVKKAFQYLIPSAKGYVNDEDIKTLIKSWDVDLTKVPVELKEGLSITTFIRSSEYVFEGVEAAISNALGIPVEIKYNMEPSNFNKLLKSRDFEVLLLPIFMDYKIVSEALNYSFGGEYPIFVKNQRVKKNLSLFLGTSDEIIKAKYLEEAIRSIVGEAEAIPLFYGSSPIVKNEKVSLKRLNKNEIYQLWNVDVE